MAAEERSRRRRPARRGIISYSLKSGKQKCLKAEQGATGHGQRERAKMEK